MIQGYKNNLYDYGIWFNGHHSTDFGLDALDKKAITFPAKRKITVQIPYSNSVLDLSNAYGGQVYEERTFSQTFNIIDRRLWNKESMYRLWTEVVNWLMEPATKQPLYDDVMHSYYYLAEVQSPPSFSEMLFRGELTIEWTCYPFRIYELAEGNDIWDKFDFDFDIAQKTKHRVYGLKKVLLYNISASVVSPDIKADSNMAILLRDQSFEVPAQDSQNFRLRLLSGENWLTVSGNGTIEFIWHKELI